MKKKLLFLILTCIFGSFQTEIFCEDNKNDMNMGCDKKEDPYVKAQMERFKKENEKRKKKDEKHAQRYRNGQSPKQAKKQAALTLWKQRKGG
jgi:hypothetical protein